MQKFIYPKALVEGDTIAICSPAGPVKAANVEGAVRVLEDQGWRVRVMPHTLGHSGQYSGSHDERFADLRDALLDDDVKAIICSRGGYGVVHLLDRLDQLPLREHAKWVAGFSDISALHALMTRHGINSLHASMTSHIAKGAEDVDNDALFKILRGERPNFTFANGEYDRPGTAEGRIVGGNLAVLADLVGTRFDVLQPDTILFIEDVSEPIYKIERMLYQLRLSGVLPRLKGLIVGRFTEYHPDASYHTMEQMIANMVAPYSYPVAFSAPIGHVNHNIPVIENARVTLKVTHDADNHLIYWQ